jgi:hypothetical protein
MENLAGQLKNLGHEVKFPPTNFTDSEGKEWQATDYYKFKKTRPFSHPDFLNNHTQRIQDHFDCVEWGDAILVANYDKNGVANYIGPNTLMEMGVAFYLKKPIYLLHPVPECPWQEEIVGMRPVVISGELSKIA